MLFSSDYPHWDFDDPGYVLRSRIPAHLRGRVGWENAIDTFGDLNTLVNNAGILRDAMSFNTTEADWDAVIKVHLKGHFTPAKFAAEYWRGRSKAGDPTTGRIINTTSESGLFGTFCSSCHVELKGSEHKAHNRFL